MDLQLDDQKPREEERPEGQPRKVWGLAAAIVAVLAALAALYYFVFMRKPEPPPAAPPPAVSPVPAGSEEAPGAPPGEPLAFPAVPLSASDEAVRQFAAALSADPEFARWLLGKDLIRTFVVAVDNVANGLSPKPHVGFFSPDGDFRVARTRSGTFIDPGAYARYGTVVRVALSLDAAAAARLYRAVDPLVQEAYNELGYPGVDFDDTLVRAMSELLEAPVVEGSIRLEQKVLSYAMTDPALEGLSAAQKQLLRMGPKGVQAVHDKILALAGALGIPSSRLPRPASYATADR
jgi:hypothetical protein